MSSLFDMTFPKIIRPHASRSVIIFMQASELGHWELKSLNGDSNENGKKVASHAGVFRGARFSSLPTNACSAENNIPFPLFYLRGKWFMQIE